MSFSISEDCFVSSCEEFLQIAKKLQDPWSLEDGGASSFLRLKKIIKDSQKALVFEYHVVYSLSYAVPMLFFNVYTVEGQLMSLTQFLKYFEGRLETTGSANAVDLKSAITQMDHPILFRPFMAIHPCRTADVLAKRPGTGNVIVAFLSLFGPFVGLELDLEYGKY